MQRTSGYFHFGIVLLCGFFFGRADKNRKNRNARRTLIVNDPFFEQSLPRSLSSRSKLGLVHKLGIVRKYFRAEVFSREGVCLQRTSDGAGPLSSKFYPIPSRHAPCFSDKPRVSLHVVERTIPHPVVALEVLHECAIKLLRALFLFLFLAESPAAYTRSAT